MFGVRPSPVDTDSVPTRDVSDSGPSRGVRICARTTAGATPTSNASCVVRVGVSVRPTNRKHLVGRSTVSSAQLNEPGRSEDRLRRRTTKS